MAEAAIEFRGFSKSFGSVTAVEDVSFSVEPGRVVGLLGENGLVKRHVYVDSLAFLNRTQATHLFSVNRSAPVAREIL